MISQSNMVFPAVIFTASGITSAPIDLSPSQSGANGAYSAGAIAVRGLSLTTATFGVLGSSDGGQTYFPLNISSVLVPGTVATTVTVTANGLYYVDLTAITHVKFVTSGTFTGTSVAIQLTGSPNGDTGRSSSGGGGGGGAVTSVFGRTGDVTAQSGDYSSGQITGLGTSATVNIGTSGATIPLLNGTNTWSGTQTLSTGASIPAGQVLSWNGDVGISRNAADQISFGNGTAGNGGAITFAIQYRSGTLAAFGSTGVQLGNTLGIIWSSAATFGTSPDVGLDRLSAGIAEVNNGTVGNALGTLNAATFNAGTSITTPSLLSPTSLIIGTANSNTLILQSNGTTRWSIGTAPGNLTPAAGNNQTIGDATHQVAVVFTNNTVSVIGTAVASATTIAPTGSIFHITGTVTISTITPPTGFDATHGGTITFIADGVFLTATGGNIANVITTVAGTKYTATWDGSLWYIK